MLPQQERVVQEKKELDEKLDKLMSFIDNNPIFKTLPDWEARLLIKQFDAMSYYSSVLKQRIHAWESQSVEIPI